MHICPTWYMLLALVRCRHGPFNLDLLAPGSFQLHVIEELSVLFGGLGVKTTTYWSYPLFIDHNPMW